MTVSDVTLVETNKAKTKDVTEIVAIIDRSGSMAPVIDDAIGGFNAFLSTQQAAGPAWFTLIQFNHTCQTLCSGIDIRDALPLDHRTYVPSGTTALLDAVGRGINDVLVRTAGRKSKVMFAILTDGHENSSRHYKEEDLRATITALKEAGWEFIFLGVGLDQFDAERAAADIDIRADKVARYNKDGRGIDEAVEAMNNAADEYRHTGRLESDVWKKKFK